MPCVPACLASGIFDRPPEDPHAQLLPSIVVSSNGSWSIASSPEQVTTTTSTTTVPRKPAAAATQATLIQHCSGSAEAASTNLPSATVEVGEPGASSDANLGAAKQQQQQQQQQSIEHLHQQQQQPQQQQPQQQQQEIQPQQQQQQQPKQQEQQQEGQPQQPKDHQELPAELHPSLLPAVQPSSEQQLPGGPDGDMHSNDSPHASNKSQATESGPACAKSSGISAPLTAASLASAAAHDTTGGMAMKIQEAAAIAVMGIPVIIAEAGSAAGAAACLHGPEGVQGLPCTNVTCENANMM